MKDMAESQCLRLGGVEGGERPMVSPVAASIFENSRMLCDYTDKGHYTSTHQLGYPRTTSGQAHLHTPPPTHHSLKEHI